MQMSFRAFYFSRPQSSRFFFFSFFFSLSTIYRSGKALGLQSKRALVLISISNLSPDPPGDQYRDKGVFKSIVSLY